MTAAAWSFFNPVRVVFRPGGMSTVGEYVDASRVGLVTTPGFSRRGVVDELSGALEGRLACVVDYVRPNPDVRDVDALAGRLRDAGVTCLLALGGGSAMDTAKGLARLLAQPEGASLARHFRDNEALENNPAMPVIALPTTAGTGAEVTPFGTLWDFELGRKYSVTGDDLYSRVALLDPDLTLGLPREVTISSGLDAISHALESAWNRHATPVTLGLVTQSLRLSLAALPRLAADGADAPARAQMMQASLLAGLAISQTRTALAHSISYPLTARFGLPHGVACSFTLPVLLHFNARADDGRLAELARALGYAGCDAFSDALLELFEKVGIDALFREHVQDRDSVMALAGEMFTPGRADNNLRTAAHEDVVSLLDAALNPLLSG